MRATTTHLLMLCAGLAGCANLGFPFAEPLAGPRYFFPAPAIVRVESAAPNQITYEYARMAGSGFPHAIAAAGRDCRPEGKRAHIVSVGLKDQARGWVIFECV